MKELPNGHVALSVFDTTDWWYVPVPVPIAVPGPGSVIR